MLEKVNHISFKNVNEAIMIAYFLKSIGFKLNKTYFEKDTYLWNFPPGFFDDRNNLRYDGFTKIDMIWRLTNDGGKIFTHSIND